LILILASRHAIHGNLLTFISISLSILIVNFVLIIPLLDAIFDVFYQVDFEEVASSIANFSFMDLFHLSDDGRMTNRNILENKNKQNLVFGYCVCVD